MRRTIFLSFSPTWYDYVIKQHKIYEHRKRFTKYETRAYLYLGLPVQSIVAILELGPRIEISDWLSLYQDESTQIRIKDFLTRNRWAMEIRSVQPIEPIPISIIKKEFGDFNIPRSFFFLDKKKEVLDYIDSLVKYQGPLLVNNFENITAKDICRY